MREAGRDDYRFSSIILGIVNSSPFQMRRSRLMIVTKMALPRRTFLRGLGDGVGAAAAGRDGSGAVGASQDRSRPVRRLGFVYVAERGGDERRR